MCESRETDAIVFRCRAGKYKVPLLHFKETEAVSVKADFREKEKGSTTLTRFNLLAINQMQKDGTTTDNDATDTSITEHSFKSKKTLFTEPGELSADGKGWCVNMERIKSYLIKKAAKCTTGASDLFACWLPIISCLGKSCTTVGDRKDIDFWFGLVCMRLTI